MSLTLLQQQALKIDILANVNTIPAGHPWSGSFVGTQVKDVPSSGDGNAAVAGWYNLTAAPNFTVWKKLVSINDVGDNLVGTDVAGLSTLNNTRLQTVAIFSAGGVNPSLADRRQFFDDIFSGAGGTLTRAKLLILWKRLATNIQKLLSVGTGSDAVPATTQDDVGDSFAIDGNDVALARNS